MTAGQRNIHQGETCMFGKSAHNRNIKINVNATKCNSNHVPKVTPKVHINNSGILYRETLYSLNIYCPILGRHGGAVASTAASQ